MHKSVYSGVGLITDDLSGNLFCRPVIMGNSESMYESQDNFYQHPPSYNNSYHQPSPYAENSENNTYHEPSSYAGTSSNTSYYQPSTHPGSSANTRHQYIADNFGSLDQLLHMTRMCSVFIEIIDFVMVLRKYLHATERLVTRNPDVPRGKLSPQAQATISSIAAASHYPLSIILVGVGDGPWDEMKHFDDNISERLFDNFQLEIRRIGVWRDIDKLDSTSSNSETNIRAAALMEIPFQYRAAQNIQLNDRESVLHQHKRPFPPPNEAIDHDNARMAIPHMTNLESAEPTAPAAVEPVCPICLTNPKDMAFGCGHTTCKECGSTLSSCPMCRQQITTPPRLYT
ncbi:hypothetical protein JHK87_015306 [Glycine soja]|nr:hypothetical protein JHK87_015306 [Glycine soja]